MITIKGTRVELILIIDDSCSFQEVLHEHSEKIAYRRQNREEPIITITVKLGNRYINYEQKKQLSDLIGEENRFTIESFESEVVRREEALTWQENSEIKSISKIVRSGQVLK